MIQSHCCFEMNVFLITELNVLHTSKFAFFHYLHLLLNVSLVTVNFPDLLERLGNPFQDLMGFT